MKEKEKIRAEIERLAQLHLEMLEGYRADGNISAAAIENVLYGHDLSILSFIDSLQEEPACEDLEEASKEWLAPQLDKSYAAYGETKQMELTHFDGYAMLDAIEFGAKWKGQQMMSKAIVREVKVDAGGYPYIDATELYDYDKDMPLAKEGDKVKILVIKE